MWKATAGRIEREILTPRTSREEWPFGGKSGCQCGTISKKEGNAFSTYSQNVNKCDREKAHGWSRHRAAEYPGEVRFQVEDVGNFADDILSS